MDILNSIKEWISGTFGDTASNITENINTDEVQQQVDDATQAATDAIEQAKDNLPK
jgi:hypothetical protein